MRFISGFKDWIDKNVQILLFNIGENFFKPGTMVLSGLFSCGNLMINMVLLYLNIEMRTIQMQELVWRLARGDMSFPPEEVSMEITYKIAITVMALRFFLKDCEQNE